ncbi:hypothetical protein KY290_025902 [Solanum tuberosum]|uniref:Uncharacterized protein n=1 Tax=Solanum tuberosum TaxID=4113 RepID=A0ABQ7UX10_SOLTU|nr:hypothetical protein KY290_025902 [Solanum tuberosum]
MDVRKDLIYGASFPSLEKHPILKFKCAPDQNSNFIFTKSFRGRLSRPKLWRQLALTAKTSHFEGRMCPRTDVI